MVILQESEMRGRKIIRWVCALLGSVWVCRVVFTVSGGFFFFSLLNEPTERFFWVRLQGAMVNSWLGLAIWCVGLGFAA